MAVSDLGQCGALAFASDYARRQSQAERIVIAPLPARLIEKGCKHPVSYRLPGCLLNL